MGWGLKTKGPREGVPQQGGVKARVGPVGPEPAAAEQWKSLNHTELLTAPKSCCTTGLERLKLLNA